jgi:hypothetical protein
MDSLTTRLEISAAVERNRAAPQERIDGYNVTRVNDTVTVVHNERVAESEEDRFYNARSMPDNGEWLQVLRRHRQSGTKFTGARGSLSLSVSRRLTVFFFFFFCSGV